MEQIIPMELHLAKKKWEKTEFSRFECQIGSTGRQKKIIFWNVFIDAFYNSN